MDMGAHTKNMGRYDDGMDFVWGYGDAKGGVLRVPKKESGMELRFFFCFGVFRVSENHLYRGA